MKAKKNIIIDLSSEFSLEVIRFAEQLEKDKKYAVAKLLVKAASSMNTTIRESQAAESKTDCIHNLKAASKKINETEYWLLLWNQAKNYPDIDNLLNLIQKIKMALDELNFTLKQSGQMNNLCINHVN